jgi:hypothetical protein
MGLSRKRTAPKIKEEKSLKKFQKTLDKHQKM